MSKQFINQKLTVTLTAKDNDGDIISLAGRTVHFLTRSPVSETETTDESPTIGDPTNGQVEHVYAAGAPGDLNERGEWLAKLLIDTEEVPSTRFIFRIYELWEA